MAERLGVNKMKKSTGIILVIAAIALCCGGWYFYADKNSKPKELIAAETAIKEGLRSPDTYKLKKAIFDVESGKPIILIEYTAANAFGTPVKNVAKFIFKKGPDYPSTFDESELAKAKRRIAENRIKEINDNSKIVAPFEYSGLESISLENGKMSPENELILVLKYQTSMLKQKDFPPHSKIGGRIEKVGVTGQIEKVARGTFPRIYTEGELFPWDK